MFRGAVLFITTGILAFGANGPLFAQSVPPASTNAAAPAAGDQTTATDKKDPSAATTAPKPKAKKVWTNDDMGDVHQSSAVSVVGSQKKGNQPSSYSPPPGQSEYMVKMYRQQIDQLQAQADAIDKQIANLQDAKNGKSVDSSRTYDPWGGKQGDWNTQIAQLEKNRDNILKQIDQVQDMIRKINP